MKVSITGGAGFLGRKTAACLAQAGKLGDRPITSLTLLDLVEPPKPDATFPARKILTRPFRATAFPRTCITSA